MSKEQIESLDIEKGKEQWGECKAGTRTIHVFGGRKIKPADFLIRLPKQATYIRYS